MAIIDVKIGSLYQLHYKSTWSTLGVQEVQIISITNKDEVQNFVDTNIFVDYFNKFQLGLETYVKTITRNTPIYVCNIIKKKDPIKFDDKPIIIPHSLIDLDKSQLLLQLEHVDINITGVSKKFVLTHDRGEYIKNIIKAIKNKLKADIHFGGIPIDVVPQMTEFIDSKENYDKQEKERERLFKVAKEAEYLNKSEDEKRLRNTIAKQTKLDEEIAKYEQLNQDLQTQQNNLLSLNNFYVTYLDQIEQKIDRIVEIVDGTTNIDTSDDYAEYTDLGNELDALFVNIRTELGI